MSKYTLVPLAVLAAALPLCAQTQKPLTEAQLMQTLDGISFGDPVRQSPLSQPPAGRAVPVAAAQDEPAAKKSPRKAGQTEITANAATFDQRSHQAVFTENVVVVNPEFTLTCDKLTAFLKHSGSPTAAEPKKGGKRDSGGLERAIAEGHVVITQNKAGDDGNPVKSTGRSQKAIYEATSGNITLLGRPEVAQGFNNLVATEDSTVIIMNHETQRAEAKGPSKTVIRDSGPETKNGR